MKVCPNCNFTNEEDVPTCAFCNVPIVDVPSTPSSNPNHPEHERRALVAERGKLIRRQIWTVGVLYALVITIMTALSGQVSSPLVLLLYFLGALVVVLAVDRRVVGQLTASFLQAIFSTILLIYFGPFGPLIFFMLSTHIVLAAYLWHWMDLIYSANR
jgi:hypothetical protein